MYVAGVDRWLPVGLGVNKSSCKLGRLFWQEMRYKRVLGINAFEGVVA